MSHPIRIAVTATAALLVGSASSIALAAGPLPTREINSVLRAKASLAEAVSTAEMKSAGHATMADIWRAPRGYEYKITVVANGKVTDEFVSLATGKIVKSTDRGTLATAFDGTQQQLFNKMMSSPTKMPGAIAAAEKKDAATAIAARLVGANGNPEIQVDLAKNDKGRAQDSATVNLATGKVVAETAAKPGLAASTKPRK